MSQLQSNKGVRSNDSPPYETLNKLNRSGGWVSQNTPTKRQQSYTGCHLTTTLKRFPTLDSFHDV